MRPSRLAMILLVAIAGCDDTLYHAGQSRQKTWDVGPSTMIVAELKGGRIDVRPGPVGKVQALTGISRVSKTSQQVADEAVKAAPGFSLTQEDDVITIVEKDGNDAVMCSLAVFVPPGTRLDLRTGMADIWIGYDPRTGNPDPVSLSKVTAKTGEYFGINTRLDPGVQPELDVEGIDLTLVVNGSKVDIAPLFDKQLPDGRKHWRSPPR